MDILKKIQNTLIELQILLAQIKESRKNKNINVDLVSQWASIEAEQKLLNLNIELEIKQEKWN